MRNILFFLLGLFLCVNSFDVVAATRTKNLVVSTSRQQMREKSESNNRSINPRSTVNVSKRQPSVSRIPVKNVSARNATNKIINTRTTIKPTRVSRAATNVSTRTFGTNYNSCRDAYFTCMDQFCAAQNDTYRRCVCSSKLQDIQSKEKTLSQTSDSLQDFESLNIEMIDKTSNEVKAMLSATDGENAIKTDDSQSAKQLQDIANVINNTRRKSTSTQGTLDIGGNIKSIWTTTNLITGADIANLTGENLFNAVHTQCSELVASTCASSDLNMVSAAYGMYIENDCAILENNLATQKTTANTAIRQTRQKMQDARLEHYDAHNAASIDTCIANVRNDILADTACGDGYIHCLDFTGRYLNITTGEPIYSPEFYQIESMISLSGDVLSNKQNSAFVSMLNKKRAFAQKDLDLCRDNADAVWNEFLRQAIVEIYQAHQQRVKSVKEECLMVVNKCYTTQSTQLSELSDDTVNLAQTLELSEEMCADKLNTCSNLYGGGEQGMSTLVATLTGINDVAIEQSCTEMLDKFATRICTVLDNDTSHSYPYGCRKYAPGESQYARKEICNTTYANPFSRSELLTTLQTAQASQNYLRMCINEHYTKRYTSCKPNYYLYAECPDNADNPICYSQEDATECHACPSNYICAGGTNKPQSIQMNLYNECGEYYIGSLYQQFAIYALQNCRRSSDTSNVLSETLITQIDTLIQKIRSSMSVSLGNECTKQNGEWVNFAWVDADTNGRHDDTGDTLHSNFYTTTGANTLWGYCRNPK